jgi:hypothetical protein
MDDEFGPVILVALCIPIAIGVAIWVYLRARERDLTRQGMHVCSRCGVALTPSVPATMCEKCERHTRVTAWLGYHLALAIGVVLVGSALVLTATGRDYRSWGGIVLGCIGGARCLQLASRIRRHTDSGVDG